jgi:hypothetical protein
VRGCSGIRVHGVQQLGRGSRLFHYVFFDPCNLKPFRLQSPPGSSCSSTSTTINLILSRTVVYVSSCRLISYAYTIFLSQWSSSFSASWTALTATACTLIFLHPSYSTHPIVSIGAQASWIHLTWIFWVVGSAVVNAALPVLLTGGSCFGLVYCGHMQALFGEEHQMPSLSRSLIS